MSYIVVLFNLPAHVLSIRDMPQDSDANPLGPRVAILTLLTHLFPDADLSDPTWVRLERDGFVIEFMVGAADPVESLGLRIHGSDQAIEVARVLCEYTGWRAYDTSLGDFIAFDDNPVEALGAWRQYRGRVIEQTTSESHLWWVEDE